MTTGEMERLVVVFQEYWFKVCQRIIFSEQSPDSVFEVGITVVELNSLHFGKLFNQGFINDKVLFAVLSR